MREHVRFRWHSLVLILSSKSSIEEILQGILDVIACYLLLYSYFVLQTVD